ncbi:AAA domain-containing protein [Lentzea sp. HUAS12]|uniref:AAA domain-containing protein n=1 Tax=Lentzea sp. HUAS12 TaxID=2951806 RepID=UPI00209CCF94|nr:AAA domain-containing protein [Lentzea sp. HUAS12]USX53243.1 AAA domain-containing protein [Lentzea sp. HUAS12]
MAASAQDDTAILRTTTNLIGFLREITEEAAKDRVRDIKSQSARSPQLVIWLGGLPEGLRRDWDPSTGVLLEIDAVMRTSPPQPPASLDGWLDLDQVADPAGPEPRLADPGPLGTDVTDRGVLETEMRQLTAGLTDDVRSAYRTWLPRWREWAVSERRKQARRALYEQLEHVAKVLDQQDDEYEFVLAIGLVVWKTPSGDVVRRHLVTSRVRTVVEPGTSSIRVHWEDGTPLRLEEREIFGDEEVFHPDRGRAARQSLRENGRFPLDSGPLIRSWFESVIDTNIEVSEDWQEPVEEPSPVVRLSASPALLLRPRSQVLLAEAYQQIEAELRDPDAEIPIGLAGLVANVGLEQRTRWLAEQRAMRSDVLGEDPLFPLPANDDQARIVDRLRTETGVVVQGPPGTGKTHTIANLICALLARGLRVLVTSEKDQALRVLREKVPPELRQLCVLLTGGGRSGADELERGVSALSQILATTDLDTLDLQTRRLREERAALRGFGAELTEQIRALREVETYQHPPVVPDYRDDAYRGVLVDIIREVKLNADAHGWMPEVPESLPGRPPLRPAEFAELRSLLCSVTRKDRARQDQVVPGDGALPVAGVYAEVLTAARIARSGAAGVDTPVAQALATVTPDRLRELETALDVARAALHAMNLSEDVVRWPADAWTCRAISDRIANRNVGLWDQLIAVAAEPVLIQRRLQAHRLDVVVEVGGVTGLGLGRATGQLAAGRVLLGEMEAGRKVRRIAPSAAQRNARTLLETATVNGASPRSAEHLKAVLERLEAELAVVQLNEKWSLVGVVLPAGAPAQMLSCLVDESVQLTHIAELGEAHRRVVSLLAAANVRVPVATAAQFCELFDAIPAARRVVEAKQAESKLAEVLRLLRSWATQPNVCPEVAAVLEAAIGEDVERYAAAIRGIDIARNEKAQVLRLEQLRRVLGSVHPGLLALLERSAHERQWDSKIAAVGDAWAWSKARSFVVRQRTADRERELLAQLEQNTMQQSKVTAELAGKLGLAACIRRMTDEHTRALNAYAQHTGNIGAGYGKQVNRLRKAARAAMDKAKDAVPAWVVPLPKLLETMRAQRDSFDVVIVDEASQAGLEQLFLLWMAPRVIVVGDDMQCAPSDGRLGPLEPMFARLDEYLPNLDADVKESFTPKSSLYGLMSARAGMRNIVRLREHFRCMPEIIGWSSAEFYPNLDGAGGGLIPLRQFGSDRLTPLKVVRVSGAVNEGKNQNLHNRAEAKAIVEQLLACLAATEYDRKTFGVVVLQGQGQVKLLEHEINSAVPLDVQQQRRIRVGSPANFQGDERDVIFLSMVVATQPNASKALMFRRAYNVAASRAKDQLWLFTSIGLDQMNPEDLRAKLLGYMQNPPTPYGPALELDDVRDDEPHPAFDSMLEQKVFRMIRARGYHVAPQYQVGHKRIDLVVSGAEGRLAVECDGHIWHTDPEDQRRDMRAERGLRRAGWEIVRVRESEFEIDRERALEPVWQGLAMKGITPLKVQTVMYVADEEE